MQSSVVKDFQSQMRLHNGVESEQEKPHISPSQINMFLDCSAKYMFRYIYGIRPPTRSFFIRGRAVHKGIEHNYKSKIETHEDLPLDEVQEVASEEFDSMVAEAVWEDGENPGEIKDKTMELVGLYHQEVAPKIQPILIEKFVEIEVPETNFTLRGYIDLVDTGGYIRDTKTKNSTPPQKTADSSLQLTAYAMAYRQLTGKTEKGVVLDNLISLKKGPKYVPLESQRMELDIRRFINISKSVIRCIQSGAYCPNPNSMMCSESKCDFWKVCQETF